ncbi:MAG TPA: ATP-grasp domain-containing protein, partial [Pseudonocardia sp.]|nr:ATP-grasp domain-containing protein [Pseudonocardia sp.]
MPTPLLGISPRPIYLLPMLRMGVMSAIVTRESADPGWAERFGAEMWDLERLSGVREAERPRAGAGDLRSRLHEVTHWDGRGFHVVSYGRYGNRWKSALEQAGARELNQPSQNGARPPRDKIAMREWFRALGVVAPASFVADRVDYRAVQRRFGSAFVAQLPRGNGGDGTYLISDRDVAEALPDSDRWLISEYAGDITVNFHGFVPGVGAPEVLRPSLQLTDVEGSGSSFGQYSGSDFRGPDRLPALALSRCRTAMRRIGTGLGELGYRGVFGVDFAIRGENAYALEVNCRMQGSTWLLGEIEFGEGSPPTMLRHIAARGDVVVAGAARSETRDATQLIVRHTGPPARLLRAPLSGVYRPQ